MKRIEIRQQENKDYKVYIDGIYCGFVTIHRNQFHNRNLYLDVKLACYDKEISTELFWMLQEETKENLQVMCESSEAEFIGFLEAGGFRCKRKCYECEVTKDDLKVSLVSSNKGFYVHFPENRYMMASRILYQQYVEKHEAINPLTAAYDEFMKMLPKEAYVEEQEEQIVNFAFVKDNEIAYVGSRKREIFSNFIAGVVEKLFENYETVCFECDDVDWEAMQLKGMFETEEEESYNTYIKEAAEI